MFWVRCWRASAFCQCGSRLAASSVAPTTRTPPFFGVPAGCGRLGGLGRLGGSGRCRRSRQRPGRPAWRRPARPERPGPWSRPGAAGFGASVGFGAAVGGFGGAWPELPQAWSSPPIISEPVEDEPAAQELATRHSRARRKRRSVHGHPPNPALMPSNAPVGAIIGSREKGCQHVASSAIRWPAPPAQGRWRGRDRAVLHLRDRAGPADPLARAVAGRDDRRGAGADRAAQPEAQRLPDRHRRPGAASRRRPPRRARCRASCSARSTASRTRSRIWSRRPASGPRSARSGSSDNVPTEDGAVAAAPQADRRRPARQDQHAELRLQGHVRQHDRAAVHEPVEAGPDVRRVLGRGRLGGGGRARADRARLGRGRLDPDPVRALRHLRAQAVVRAGAVRADGGPLRGALPQRPDDSDRPRRGDPAPGDGRPGRA